MIGRVTLFFRSDFSLSIRHLLLAHGGVPGILHYLRRQPHSKLFDLRQNTFAHTNSDNAFSQRHHEQDRNYRGSVVARAEWQIGPVARRQVLWKSRGHQQRGLASTCLSRRPEWNRRERRPPPCRPRKSQPCKTAERPLITRS